MPAVKATVRARIRVGTDDATAVTVSMDERSRGYLNELPAKEWTIADDVLNVADSACVTVENSDGENTGKFTVGQRVEIDVSDSDVASGQWLRQFTGRVVALDTYSDVQGGSNIMVSCFDLGWHLTSSHGRPLANLNGITWIQLLSTLIDPSWGFGPIVADNSLNRRLKQGRTGITRALQGIQGSVLTILPYIQIEPGQAPWEIISTYAQREGVLVNVGADGSLIFFRPDYTQDASYALHYHASTDAARNKNNVLGRPSLHEAIDGLYSEVQVFSTVVNPQKIRNPENPNAMLTKSTFTPPSNPLPFVRREVMTDSESITRKLQINRAKWRWQMGQFESWQYDVDLLGHSQNGRYFVSDTIISCNDTVNGVVGGYYVQSVRRSSTISEGLRTKLTIRKPGLLNPALTAFDLGGGTKKSSKTQVPTP